MVRLTSIHASAAFRTVLLFMLGLTALLTQAQDKQVANALLWKVTGNSLLKPSFLFGTIHLQDKRVFNFSDSLYSFLQRADGFAMEIHPDSIVSAMLEKEDDELEAKLLRKYLKKDEFEKLSRELKKDFNINAENLSLRDAYFLKQRLIKPDRKPDDMPTFVDAYLFGMAKNQGKEIVGLEKAVDQVRMLDDIKGGFDVKAMVKGLKKEKSLLERLIQLYMREDLKSINEMMSYLPDDTENKLLTLRNHVMVSKMDSIIRDKSFVVAVGTAHLPGDQGIIQLLRKKGYTVEPVFTTSRTHANDYAVKASQKYEWVDVKEPEFGYSTRMPGKPSPMNVLDGSMKMNMYMDLTSMKMYYTAFVLPTLKLTDENIESVLQGMCNNMMSSSNGKAISSKRFKRDGFEAIDFVFKQQTENMYVRMQAMAQGKRVYLVGFGSPRQEDISGKDAIDFFDAFKIGTMPLPVTKSWQTHTNNDYFFSVSLPQTPKIVPIEGDSSVRSMQFNSADIRSGAYYGLTVVTTNPAFNVPDDTAYFSGAIEAMKETIDMRDFTMYDTTFNGFNARRFKASAKENLWMSCIMINRGNRMYTLLVVCNREDSSSHDVRDFFNSFRFIDYPEFKWKEKKLDEYLFVAPVPTQYAGIDFLDEDEDRAAHARDFQWTAYDSATATSFFVTRNKISPYLWAKHDSVLLIKYMRDMIDPSETLLDYKMVRNGNSNGLEFAVRKNRTTQLQRIRILLSGQAIYLLQADAPLQYWKQYNFQNFFDDFRFMKEEKHDFLYTNSFQKFIAALKSEDSATYTNAQDAIYDILIDSTDLTSLLQAASFSYKGDSINETAISEKLFDLAIDVKHSRFNQVVEAHYNSLQPEQEEFKFDILRLLARKRTSESYSLIEKLLKTGVPVKGNSSGLVYALEDSLQLLKQMYPWLISQSSAPSIGTLLFSQHVKVLDSNIVSIDEFRAREAVLFEGVKKELQVIASRKESYYYNVGVTGMIELLAKLGSEDAYALLRKFLSTKYNNIKYDAAIQLLKSRQKVDAGILLSLAADTSYRIMLYEELKELKQEKLFPAKYLTQQAFADGYLYASFDYAPSRIVLLGERTISYKGKKQKFYLYKCTIGAVGEESATYLSVVGGFNTDGKTLKIKDEENVSGMYTDEEFKQSLIDRHFKAYLKQWEEIESEVKED